MFLPVLARILGSIVTIYMILCTIRIFLTWSPDLDRGDFGRILGRIVDPWLHWFSRFSILRSGRFDFTPILALAVLSVFGRVFATLAYTGRLTIGVVLGIAAGAAWSAVSFVVSFAAACVLVRMLVLVMRWNSLHPISVILDALLNPVLLRINRLVYRDRIVDYQQGLITGFIVLLVVRVAGGALVALVVRLLYALPV